MCDGHAGLSRRQFLGGASVALAAPMFASKGPAGLRRLARRVPLQSPVRPADAAGNLAYSMAMHIHSSFSEFSGSMQAHLYQAQLNAVDVLWWTEHNERLNGLDYRDTVHFTSLTQETGNPGQGGIWTWQKQESGPLAAGSGGIVQTPCSPDDPVAGGALHVRARSAGTAPARYGYYANAKPSYQNYHCSLNGQTVSVDVRPGTGWTRGFLEVAIATSWHGPSAGRPNGQYTLSYQLVPAGVARRTARSNAGTVTIPVTPGTWQTVTLTPCDDIAVLWPDLDSRDFALAGLTLSAASTGDLAGGYFDYMRFDRTMSGEMALQAQQDMMTSIGAGFPGVTQQQGLELSLESPSPHCNWFGPAVAIQDYGDMTQARWEQLLVGTLIPRIHSSGGLASYNHPYGTNQHATALPQATQDALLQRQAVALLDNGALGADLIEVGYPLRAGVDLAHHAGLWDVLSRNAMFLTGNGVSDDHLGWSWKKILTNWLTMTWAASPTMSDTLAALAAGRAWCGSLSGFSLSAGGSLDLLVDGICPMGSVSVSALTSRQLAVTGTGIPAGGTVAVLQGTVDYAGTSQPVPNTAAVASWTGAELAAAGGTVTYAADTTDECFARLAVADATGTVVALSNPVWMLHNQPPNGIPAPRQV